MPKATLISVVPFLINEHKPLFPGVFFIPGVEKTGDINVLVIDGDPKHHMYIDETRGSITMYAPVVQVAEAVVQDHRRASIAVNDDAAPGFGWLEGEWTVEMLKKEPTYSRVIVPLHKQQEKWFHNLVQLADDDWAKYRQHRTISDVQRHAARTLGLGREWLTVVDAVAPRRCPACQQNISAEAAICSFCRCIVNPEAAKKLAFALPA